MFSGRFVFKYYIFWISPRVFCFRLQVLKKQFLVMQSDFWTRSLTAVVNTLVDNTDGALILAASTSSVNTFIQFKMSPVCACFPIWKENILWTLVSFALFVEKHIDQWRGGGLWGSRHFVVWPLFYESVCTNALIDSCVCRALRISGYWLLLCIFGKITFWTRTTS